MGSLRWMLHVCMCVDIDRKVQWGCLPVSEVGRDLSLFLYTGTYLHELNEGVVEQSRT